MSIETDLELQDVEAEEHEEMADAVSGVIGVKLAKFLLDYVEANNLGWVFSAETDFVLPDIGKRRPDVAFCSFETLPELPRAVVPTPPDLAVEITSSRDEIDPTDKKVKEYRKVKIKLVWVIKPEGEVVEVYRDGEPTDLLGINKELNGDPVIPGFRLSVAKLFDWPRKSG